MKKNNAWYIGASNVRSIYSASSSRLPTLWLSFMQKRDTLVGKRSVRNEQKVINI